MSAWERQEGETPKAYAAFCVYRDMGTGRSLEKYARALGGRWKETGRIPSHVAAWSSRYSWPARAAAWDEHLVKKRDEGIGEAAKSEAFQDHLRRLTAFSKLAVETGTMAIRLAQRSMLAISQLPAEAVTAGEAQQLLKAGIAAAQWGFDSEAAAIGLDYSGGKDG